jgi:cell division protease FtsH
VARDVDHEIQRILEENYQRAKNLLIDHQHALHEISKVLIEKETLDTQQIDDLLKQLEGQEPPTKPERTYAKWHSQLVISPSEGEPEPAIVSGGEESPATESKKEENI